LTVSCKDISDEGDLEARLEAQVGGGMPPYSYTVFWGDDSEPTGGNLTGTTFALRHAYPRPRTDPVTYKILVGVSDSVFSAQQAGCELSHRVDSVSLDIDCEVSPRQGPAPLTVRFDARKNECIGDCAVVWDFGDGGTFTGDSAVHTYTAPGPAGATWPARGTLRDSAGRERVCHRPIEVLPPEPPPGPTPTPGPTPAPTPTPSNQPPVITGFTANPPVVMLGQSSQLTATVTDPDGDPVTWTLNLEPGSSPGTLTPASGSGNVSSVFRGNGVGQATIRVLASDGRGGTAQAVVTVTVSGGG
jgi:hypothetical protein